MAEALFVTQTTPAIFAKVVRLSAAGCQFFRRALSSTIEFDYSPD